MQLSMVLKLIIPIISHFTVLYSNIVIFLYVVILL